MMIVAHDGSQGSRVGERRGGKEVMTGREGEGGPRYMVGGPSLCPVVSKEVGTGSLPP